MLNFIYYPVSAILWFWHQAFGYLLGPGNGFAWALAVVFLVFTLRALLFKPFVSQVRSMRKMQEFAPEIQKLKKKYGDDRQKMATEMQKLQSEHGVNPVGGCLPVLVQIPVFIGLFHVLRSFNRPFLSAEQNRLIGNYVFSAADVRSFLDAHLFGVPLSAFITEPAALLARYGDISRWQIAVVAVPLTVVAGVLTHLTAKHSVARQSPAQLAANPQAALMSKVTVYLFPLGVVGTGPFFPLAILLYWLSNNLWTLAQQRVVYQWIDAEDAEKKEAAIAQRQALGPRPGQKPTRPKRDVTGTPAGPGGRDSPERSDAAGSGPVGSGAVGSGPAGSGATGPGATGSGATGSGATGPGATPESGPVSVSGPDPADSNAVASNGVAPQGAGPKSSGSKDARLGSEGSSNGQGAAPAGRSVTPGMIQRRPRPGKKTNRKRR
ncbi:MAG: membrane protein insertase YidC [Pseudonocardiales bacterium]|nr:membrane protein insertase YidC [Pseudonocardiales bacterium]MBV9031330.1 membrane protein insertase YidC [Pseudonocardiales bacterium]MBW0011041.1 membrane protein insertase YidC [Pseudonocardiales bacterium]